MTPAPIYLNEEESRRFMLFMEHYEFIHNLEESGVFDIRNGSCKINIDGSGRVTSTEVTIVRRP